jgi:hypothetical protein
MILNPLCPEAEQDKSSPKSKVQYNRIISDFGKQGIQAGLLPQLYDHLSKVKKVNYHASQKYF